MGNLRKCENGSVAGNGLVEIQEEIRDEGVGGEVGRGEIADGFRFAVREDFFGGFRIGGEVGALFGEGRGKEGAFGGGGDAGGDGFGVGLTGVTTTGFFGGSFGCDCAVGSDVTGGCIVNGITSARAPTIAAMLQTTRLFSSVRNDSFMGLSL